MNRFKGLISIVILVIVDLMAMFLSYFLGYLVRAVWAGGATGAVLAPALLSRIYLLVIYPFVFAYEGLYTKRLTDWEERRRCLRGVIIGSALLTIIMFMVRLWIVSRFVVLLSALFGVVLVPLFRAVLKRWLVRLKLFHQPLVIVGSGAARRFLEDELLKHRTMGYQIVCRIERQNPDEDVEAMLARVTIPQGSLVVVLADCFTEPELRKIFRYAERSFAEMMMLPGISLVATSSAEVEQIGSLLVLKYRYNLLRPLNIWTKQVLEFVLSLVLTIILLPLFAVLALLVKISSPGPVFFRQPRIGKNGRVFTCLKFRTMYQDAEARLQEILRSNPAVRAEWERFARITADPRVTPIGRLLRRFSLDELPQLLNVIKGDMALVGPRPYLLSELERVGEYIKTIVRVRPGLTGLWQVSGRAELPFQERMILDEYYIRNWSLWLDFSILVRTIKAVLTGRGAY
uniref:Undecaprenyl-phosphate galactose phosphotransferase WbaP n=1 Tax=candidate division WOR-3 bacterium TaxID=2052148 RepID=A0A7V3UZN2_UNCW3